MVLRHVLFSTPSKYTYYFQINIFVVSKILFYMKYIYAFHLIYFIPSVNLSFWCCEYNTIKRITFIYFGMVDHHFNCSRDVNFSSTVGAIWSCKLCLNPLTSSPRDSTPSLFLSKRSNICSTACVPLP